MTNCTQKRIDGERPVDRLFNGDLLPTELDEVEAHIESCEDCAETKRILEGTRGVWKSRQDPQMPRALRDRVEDKLFAAIEADKGLTQSLDSAAKEVRRPRWGFLLGAVAAAAVLLVALYFTARPSEEPDTNPIVANSPDQTDKVPSDKTQPGITATITDIRGGLASYEKKGEAVKPVVLKQVLSLGETITIGKGASVRFAFEEFAVVALGDGAIAELISEDGVKGIVLKRGCAALNVKSEAIDDIFKVKTPAGDVEVKGTIFYISVSASAKLTVAVVESTVTVRDSANPRNVIPVHSGQEIDVDWSDPKVESIDPDLEKKIHVMLSPGEEGSAKKQDLDRNRIDAEEMFEKATRARKSGNIQEAAELYQRIIEMNAKRELRAEAAFNLGQLYFTTGNINRAESVLVQHSGLIEKSSFRDMFLFYLAKAKCRLGKSDEANRVIDEFLNRSPNHSLADSMRKLKETCRP